MAGGQRFQVAVRIKTKGTSGKEDAPKIQKRQKELSKNKGSAKSAQFGIFGGKWEAKKRQ